MKANPFLSAQDICTIVETCAKRRVAKLQFGALLVEFNPEAGSRPSHQAPGPAKPEASEEVIREQKTAEEAALTEEEIVTREEQIAELWLTDPLRAEEMLESGDLQPDTRLEESDGELS